MISDHLIGPLATLLAKMIDGAEGGQSIISPEAHDMGAILKEVIKVIAPHLGDDQRVEVTDRTVACANNPNFARKVLTESFGLQ